MRNRRNRYLVPSLTAVAGALIVWALSFAHGGQAPNSPQSIEVRFQPGGGTTAAIVRELGRAQRSIHVEAYVFTSVPIAKALVDAENRGVDVEVILDKSNRRDRYSAATFLANHGIPTYIDYKHAIAHSKNIIVDGSVVITGSFNFTKSAEERNAETSLMIRGFPDVARKFEDNFALHKGHSELYERWR